MSAANLSTRHEWTLKARWVFPVDRPPLERGTVTVAGERIEAVEPHGQRTADIDLGNTAILPGLVNAHTHLDLSGLRGRCPPGPDFTAWLRAVIGHRRSQTTEQVAADIRAGLAESLACGTTLLGDISAGGQSWPALVAAPLRAVVFHELLGLPRERAEQAWSNAESWLQSHPATDRCRPGLSPHAAYSVCDWLFNRAADAARERQLPLTTHLAETLAEIELLKHQSGPFVAFLSELGVWDPDGLVLFPEEIWHICSRATALFIHCNYLDPVRADVTGGTVVYCPRTHAAFGHAPHPFRQLLSQGIAVALGTDSLASNPDLDVLAEARVLCECHPFLPGDFLLRMATLSGAEALGWQDETGSLTPGKSADLIVMPLPNEEASDPHPLVLASSLPVQRLLIRGRWIYEDPDGKNRLEAQRAARDALKSWANIIGTTGYPPRRLVPTGSVLGQLARCGKLGPGVRGKVAKSPYLEAEVVDREWFRN